MILVSSRFCSLSVHQGGVGLLRRRQRGSAERSKEEEKTYRFLIRRIKLSRTATKMRPHTTSGPYGSSVYFVVVIVAVWKGASQNVSLEHRADLTVARTRRDGRNAPW